MFRPLGGSCSLCWLEIAELAPACYLISSYSCLPFGHRNLHGYPISLLHAWLDRGGHHLRTPCVTSALVLPLDDQPRGPLRLLAILWKIQPQPFDDVRLQDCSAWTPNSEGLMNWTCDGWVSSASHSCCQRRHYPSPFLLFLLLQHHDLDLLVLYLLPSSSSS
jgi:hypothetical protein